MRAVSIAAVLAQLTPNPANPTPTLNDGGWVYNAAILVTALGILVLLLIVFGYMRFAPRFQTEEGERRSVKAPRLGPGKEVRRPVNVVGAPVIAQPPVVATVGAPRRPPPSRHPHRRAAAAPAARSGTAGRRARSGSRTSGRARPRGARPRPGDTTRRGARTGDGPGDARRARRGRGP